MFESGKPAGEQPGVTYRGTTNGVASYDVGSGSYRFLAAVANATSVNSGVAGTVPATLALSVGPASLGTLTPGVAKDYTAEAVARVTSTAGDARADRVRPERCGDGPAGQRRVRARPAAAGGRQADRRLGRPDAAARLVGPVANDEVKLAFKQSVGADEGLRTGGYAKTLTFTVSARPLHGTDLRLGHEVRGQGVPFREAQRTWIHAVYAPPNVPCSSIGAGPDGSR